MGTPAPFRLRWSRDADAAGWIRSRLGPFGSGVTFLVPGGFEAYARVLHPARDGDRPVRWAEVAAWSGRTFERASQFHAVAVPASPVSAPPPWSQGPRNGSLDPADAAVLAEVLARGTATPDRCWFAVWEGFGWDNRERVPQGGGAARLGDPVPVDVRQGPRVALPHRNHLLLTGPADAVVDLGQIAGDGQMPSLWWPADRAWCVASDVDLTSTYVGASRRMVERLCADPRVEVIEAFADDPLWCTAAWLEAAADEAAAQVLAHGEASMATGVGPVTARLEGSALWVGTSRSLLTGNDDGERRREVSWKLVRAVLDRTGG